MSSSGEASANYDARSWQAAKYVSFMDVAIEAVQTPSFNPIAQHEYLQMMRSDIMSQMEVTLQEHGPQALHGRLLRSYNQYNHAFGLLDKIMKPGITMADSKAALIVTLNSHRNQRAFNAFEDNVSGKNQIDDVIGYDTYLLLATGVVPEATSFDNAIRNFGADAVLATLSPG